MSDWVNAKERLPADHHQKLVIAYNSFQDRWFYAVAFCCDGEWNTHGCKVRYWTDLPPMPEEAKTERRKK